MQQLQASDSPQVRPDQLSYAAYPRLGNILLPSDNTQQPSLTANPDKEDVQKANSKNLAQKDTRDVDDLAKNDPIEAT